MRTLLTLSLPVKEINDTFNTIRNLSVSPDVIELRLDYLSTINLPSIKHLLEQTNRPYIITLRSKTQGGNYQFSEQQRLTHLKQLASLQPDYLDIEHTVNDTFITQIKRLSPTVKLVKSYHNFTDTPDDLRSVLSSMLHPQVSIYKLITTAHSSLDTLRMLSFVKNQSPSHHLIGHCMGEHGAFGRIAGAILGNYFTYSCLTHDNSTAPNMVSFATLTNKFFLTKKNNKTRLYALLGNPISQSIGDVFHNQYFHQNNLNALYLKIKLNSGELKTFFNLIKPLPFSGFSITMPLKRAILPFVTRIAQPKLTAINTLKITTQELRASNTDGLGAIKALQSITSLTHKKILLLGAGGTAEAIAHALHNLPVTLIIVNRTLASAKKLAHLYQAKAFPIHTNLNTNFAVIINTMPEQALENKTFLSWIKKILLTRPVVLNAPYNQPKNILQQLTQHYSCNYVSGKHMYLHQAKEQQREWKT